MLNFNRFQMQLHYFEAFEPKQLPACHSLEEVQMTSETIIYSCQYFYHIIYNFISTLTF